MPHDRCSDGGGGAGSDFEQLFVFTVPQGSDLWRFSQEHFYNSLRWEETSLTLRRSLFVNSWRSPFVHYLLPVIPDPLVSMALVLAKPRPWLRLGLVWLAFGLGLV